MSVYVRKTVRRRIHSRIRKKLSGTAERPRLSVHFSGRHIYAQVIDDEAGVTLVSACTREPGLRKNPAHASADAAAEIGRALAQRGREKNIGKVVFDRGGFHFHGKVKALADAAREGGFEF